MVDGNGKGKRALPDRKLRTLQRQARFLRAYATGFPTAKSAAKRAKVGRTSHIRWLATDPKYAERFNQLRADRVEEFEAEAARRAVTGVTRPMTVAGESVEITEYSDALLMFILKAERPEKYKERHQLDHSVSLNEWAEVCRRSRELSNAKEAGGPHN